MLDFDPDKVEVHFAQNTILQVKLGMIELEFNVKALLDAHLHLDWPVGVWLCADVGHNEFLLLRYAIVITVDHHVNVISQVYHYAIVGLKLLLNSVELKIIRDIVGQSSWRLQISHDLKESGVLVLVIEILDHSHELNANSQVVYSLVFVESNGDLALDVFSILCKKRRLI